MSHIKGWLEQDFPGIYVHNSEIPKPYSPDGRINSVLIPMDKQAELLNAQIEADGNLTDGFDLVCHSQGGLTCRAYIEKYGGSKVHNFVSLAGPHQGVYGVPIYNGECPDWKCPELAELMAKWAAEGWNVTFAQYWKDPFNYARYLATNDYLTAINNERADSQNATYKRNLVGIGGNLTLVMATEDHIVVPKESAWFDFYAVGQDKTIVDMTETDGYKGDWIGLKTLNEAGRLQRLAAKCTHQDLPREQCKSVVYDAIIKPRVGGQLP
uniref:GPI inositol-deacylase n=2 Tax=Neobodo designis TaxID=312471 RepID=A0A7S1LKN7_NEODS